MNALLASVIPSLAWALLDFVWQGVLVGWSAALALGLMRRARPQARYAVACAALLLCAALPLAGTLQRLFDAHAATTVLFTLPLPLASGGDGAVAGAAGPAVVNRLALSEQGVQQQLPLIMLLWAAGATALGLRMALGLAWVRHRSHPARSRFDPAWQARVTGLAGRFGIARPVRLGLVDDLPSPVTAGWWRPVILLPTSLASGMPVELLEALLAHELAHIARHDYLVNLMQGVIEIVLFYHPAVWWLSNRIRLEREQVADDLAASVLGDPRRLALALSALDRFQLAATSQLATTSHLAHAAHGGNLMNRIKRLVLPQSESPGPLTWKMLLPSLALGLGLAASGVALYANAQAAPPASASVSSQGAGSTSVGIASAEPYVLVRRGTNRSTGGGDYADQEQIEAAKRAIPGDFLWFRRGGKAYVVRDAGVVAKAIDTWAPVDRLGEQMDGDGREMDRHGRSMEALGRKMEKAANGGAGAGQARAGKNGREIEALERQQERLGRQMEQLAGEMEGAGKERRAELHRQMKEVGQQMGAAGRQMGRHSAAMGGARELAKAQAREAGQPTMEEISREMKDAGKPMEALGKKMHVLGRQIDTEARVADKAMRHLIGEALARGLATPAT
jgi:beta-lactamase regulating signal transducer with metallopeptidase domain